MVDTENIYKIKQEIKFLVSEITDSLMMFIECKIKTFLSDYAK